MSLLEVKNLSVAFRSEGKFIDAVQNISFNVEKGKKLAIVGESGSGKSVTSLAIMGLLPQKISRISSGEIFFDSKNIFQLTKRRAKKIARERYGDDFSGTHDFAKPFTYLWRTSE